MESWEMALIKDKEGIAQIWRIRLCKKDWKRAILAI
jgi:hypothetical protein